MKPKQKRARMLALCAVAIILALTGCTQPPQLPTDTPEATATPTPTWNTSEFR